MSADEVRRARLVREVGEIMSADSAETLVEMFPPVGERVATKSDLDVLNQLLHHKVDTEIAGVRAEIAGLRGDMRVEMMQFAGLLRSEMAGLRDELRSDMADVRSEMAGLRDELRSDMADVRSEMAGLRDELRSDMADVRSEMAGLRDELRSDMADVRSELRTETSGLRVGMAELRADMESSLRRFYVLNTTTLLAALTAFGALLKLT